MKKTTLLCMILVISVLITAGQTAAAVLDTPAGADIGIIIDGKIIQPERKPVLENNRLLVPARTTLACLGAKVEWYEKCGLIEIDKDGMLIYMGIGCKYAIVDGKTISVDAPPILIDGTVMVPLKYITEAYGVPMIWDDRQKLVRIGKNADGSPISRGDERKEYVVVIDAGHGGEETGATYGGIKEKNLNLEIAVRLEELLKKEGIRTFMTRKSDVYKGLYERSELANKAGADLLISIHNNADGMNSSGSMTLYYPGKDNSKGNLTAERFATIVQNELTGELEMNNKGVIPRPNLAVLRTAGMPAVIAEIGYMSNSSELEKLIKESFWQDAAEALKNAVLAALNEI